MIIEDEIYMNRPTRAEISIPNLINNFEIVKSCTGKDVKIMAVVKANAYGHGIQRVTRELLKAGASYVGVAYLEEAKYLRKNGITAPILVLGAINTEQIPEFINNDIEITTSSIDKSLAISKAALDLGRKAKVHIKIDTGMGRIGVQWYNAEKFIDTTFSLPDIEVKGIFSHLAKSESDREFTGTQLSRFEEVLSHMQKNNMLPPLVHLANSGGVINHKDTHFNMVRPGIIVYGYNPNGYIPEQTWNGRKLKPVMTLKTKVSYFKVCPPGTGISYNHTYRTKEQTRIVTLPVGYGDGYSRLLSNKGETIIRGKKYRIAGNVCMDQIMVDIGPDGTAYNGDDVLLFGRMGDCEIPLETLCDKVGTITYELLCDIGSRVPRIYID